MLDRKTAVLACAIVAAAGSMTSADVTVDGKITAGDNYGPAKWIQTVPVSSAPTAGDNLAGMGNVGAASVGDPSAPSTGIELAIPYSAIGIAGPLPASVKLQVILSNGNGENLSNQNLPGLVLNTANLNNSRTTNFNTIAGNQYYGPTGSANPAVTISIGATTANFVIDGSRNSVTYLPSPPAAPNTVDTANSDAYGSVTGARLQTNSTGYGDAGHGRVVYAGDFGPAGSELDAISVRKNDTTQMLYVMVTGNLETGGNRVNIFFDTVAGGQNRLLATSNFYLAGMGDDGSGNGLTFDTGFDPDYVVSVNASRTTQPEGTPEADDQYRIYVDYSALTTGVGATNVYCGNTVFPTVAGFAGGTLTEGDVGAPAIKAALNNVNTVGVVGGTVGGDFRAPSPDYAYGNEIDGVFSKIEGGKLYVLVTGNNSTTFSKLNLFFDCQAGGQNRLRGNSALAQNYIGNPDCDFNGLNRMGADQLGTNELNETIPLNGLKFDTGFDADYWIEFTNGPASTVRTPVEVYSNACVLRTSGMLQDFNGRAQDYSAYDGGRKYAGNFPMDFDGVLYDGYATGTVIRANYAPRTAGTQAAAGLTPLPFLITMANDNSNVAGVTIADASGAAAVTTGVEFSITLTELIDGGWDGTSPIRMAGFISNDDAAHVDDRFAFVANQVIGGLPLNGGQAGDLGDPRNIDFSAIAGDQWVTLTTVAPAQCGPADIGVAGGEPGHDMLLDNNDFIAFITYFFAQDPVADLGVAGGEPGSDGLYDNNDFIAFITFFFAGCP